MSLVIFTLEHMLLNHCMESFQKRELSGLGVIPWLGRKVLQRLPKGLAIYSAPFP